jgi:ABC-2 type transport system permease protein
MNAILLVALREFRQAAKTRGFRIMLFGLPLVFALWVTGVRYFAPPSNSAYIVYDAGNGAVAGAIDRRIDQDTSRPGSAPNFLRAEIPSGTVTDKGADAFGAWVAPLLKGSVQTKFGPRQLVAAIYIPANYGNAGTTVRIWTSGAPETQLIAAVRAGLTEIVQLRALVEGGTALQTARRVQALRAPIIETQPSAGSGRAGVVIRSAAPLATMYLLLMVSIMSGSMMVQGVLEERSNKLLESILACIRPDQLMNGKLFGLAAIGLLLVAVWVGLALLAAYTMTGPVGDFLRPAVAALNQPWMIAALLFYFMAGYLVVSLMFLAIGSVSNSPQDAQSLLMPLIWALMIPIILMMTAVLRDPGSLFPRVLSWIPIYTPFAMLARLGSGVQTWEVAGSGMLLAAFLALEFALIGRIFEGNILSTGQPPTWNAIAKMILRK